MATWQALRDHIVGTYRIDRDMGNGFILWARGSTQQHLTFIGLNNPGFGSDDYVSAEISLGHVAAVDLKAALQSGANLLGGAGCFDDTVSLRDSRCLSTLTPHQFDISLSYLSGAVEGYYLSTGPEQ